MGAEIFTDNIVRLPSWMKVDNVAQSVGLLVLMNNFIPNISATDQAMILVVNSAIHGLLHDTSCAYQRDWNPNAS